MIAAVIDSCIIFGMPLCDTLLRAAEQNLYRIILSQKILKDATRNMVIKGRLKPDREQYYQQQILLALDYLSIKTCQSRLPVLLIIKFNNLITTIPL
jgi:hypothetical protein